MLEPRPRMTSARPPEIALSVEKRWNTRTGSSELNTVTADPRWMREVRAAIAPSTTSPADSGKSSVWCSPIPKKSTPTWSARTPCSTMFRIVWACESGRSSSSCVTSPKVSRPKASGNCTGAAPDGVVVMSMLSFWYGSERAGAGLRCLGADSPLKLGSVQRRTEDRAPWFEQAARAQTVELHSVVPDALDEFRHHLHRTWIVAGNPERAAFRRASWSAFVFKLVVADVVEGLDDRRPHEPALDDLAAAVSTIFEHLLNAVDGRPVVHRIDDELAVQQGRVQRRELVQRDRQHHKVCLLDGLGCPSWLGPRRQHLYDQLDLLRVTRGRDRHLVA